jgi:hypothetical protein
MRAVEQVRECLSLPDAAPPEEMLAALTGVERVVREAIGGNEVDISDLSSAITSRRLLDHIRREFVAQAAEATEHVDVDGLVQVLSALEHVQSTLDADAAQRFASRLAAPDALELLVEVAHDMRSPLSAILFLAERLRSQQSGPITPTQERQLGLMYGAAFGLSSLASDVIALARGGDPLVEPQAIPFSVATIFDAVRDILQPVAEHKGLELRIVTPESAVRVGHPMALQRTLLNLATNALKFTSTGYVEVSARPKSKTALEFSVSDTGRGIPPQVLASLFEAFRQRQSHGSYAFSSAGLGLSICQKLIAAMGGVLRVDTKIEAGTRFSFELNLPVAARL